MSTTDDSVPPTANEAEAHGRRKFLTKSAVLLTALGISGGAARAATPSTAWGGATAAAANPTESAAEGTALNDVLTEAASTGDIQSALKAHGQALSPQAQAILSKLTSSDLKEISSLQTKLAGLRGSVAADNNGTVGM